MPKDVLVIGGGIAGIQASLDIAERGGHVFLVEKTPSIGGRMAQLDKTFPTNDCSICILAPKMAECHSHSNIDVLTYSEVVQVEGEVGNFDVKILKKARFVDESTCTGCEECVTKCPVKVPNEFDQGLGERKAIYMPFPQAVPRVVTIDKENCTWFLKGKCGACKILCKREAVDFEQKDEEVNVKVGSIIVAIGYDLWDPTPASEYGYGKYPNVFTGMEYERMMNAAGPTGGEIKRRSDGERPNKIAFIQCVGSRNPQLGHAYCCAVCCMFSTKEAMLAKEHHEDIESTIFYKDIRAFGKGFNEYVERAKKDYGVRYVNSDATVQENPENNNPIVVYDIAGRPAREEFDMVILATTLIPRSDAMKISEMLDIPLTEFGFFESKDRILDPVSTSREGVFLAGYCREPMDIPESVAEGSAAAARAIQAVLAKVVNA